MTNEARSEMQDQPASRFYTVRPGRLPYLDGLRLQQDLLQQRPGQATDYLVLLEHLPVITYGRGNALRHLLATEQALRERGVELHRVARGGDITYHGPGQLVGYPIVALPPGQRDLHGYLRRLERVLIRSVARLGVSADLAPDHTGVWVGGKKLASIGVGVRRWITWHGFALNVAHRLEGFATIVPCGLSGVEMTSLEACLGRVVTRAEVESLIIQQFAEVFSAEYLGDYEYSTTP